MQKSLFLVLLFALLIVPSVFAQDATQEATEELAPSFIRLGHFAPGAPAVDVYLNGELTSVTGLAFGSTSAWLELAPGQYEVAVTATGAPIEEAVVGPATLPLPSGRWYTVAVVPGADGRLSAQLIEQDVSPLAPGTARVIFFDAVQDAPTLNILRNGVPFISELMFAKGFSIDIDAGQYDFQAVTADNATVIADITGVAIRENAYYLFVPAGTTAEDDFDTQFFVVETDAVSGETIIVTVAPEITVEPAITTEPEVTAAPEVTESPAATVEVTTAVEATTEPQQAAPTATPTPTPTRQPMKA